MMDRGMVVKWFEFCRVENKCSKDCPYWDNKATPYECTGKLAKDVLTLLKEQQPDVVRCKDCKHCYFASNRVPDEQSHACEKHGIDVTRDWFCADGERR